MQGPGHVWTDEVRGPGRPAPCDQATAAVVATVLRGEAQRSRHDEGPDAVVRPGPVDAQLARRVARVAPPEVAALVAVPYPVVARKLLRVVARAVGKMADVHEIGAQEGVGAAQPLLAVVGGCNTTGGVRVKGGGACVCCRRDVFDRRVCGFKLYTHMCTWIHIHAHMHARTHILAHTDAGAHACTHTHTRTHARALAHKQKRTHTETHTRTHARSHTHTHLRINIHLKNNSQIISQHHCTSKRWYISPSRFCYSKNNHQFYV